MDSPVFTSPPSGMCHSATVPSVIVMPSLGMRTSVAISGLRGEAEEAAAGRELQRASHVDHHRPVAEDAERGALARLEHALALAVEGKHARPGDFHGLAQADAARLPEP